MSQSRIPRTVKLRDFLLADAEDYFEEITRHTALILEHASEIRSHAQELLVSVRDLSVTLYRAVKAGNKEVPMTTARETQPVSQPKPNLESLLRDPEFLKIVNLSRKFNTPGGSA